MPIPNFSSLLSDALNGKPDALQKWDAYISINGFNQDEINRTLKEIESIILANSFQKSYALYLRASMHQAGLGGEKNYPEAVRFYNEAIKLGNSFAMSARAFMHYAGLGEEKNYPEAIRLYEEAIKLNNVEAMNFRAMMHLEGLGGEKNYPEAIRLCEEAIKLSNAEAMNFRAMMHQQGLGGEKNYPEAIRLLEKAIKSGSAQAMTFRAFMHQEGLGGERNYGEAIRLYEEASKLGCDTAKECLLSLQKKLTVPENLLNQYLNQLLTVPNRFDTSLKGHKQHVIAVVKNVVEQAKNIQELVYFYNALSEIEAKKPFFKKERHFFRTESGMTYSWQTVLDIIKKQAMEIAKNEQQNDPDSFKNNQTQYEDLFKIHRSRIGFGKTHSLEKFERLISSQTLST